MAKVKGVPTGMNIKQAPTGVKSKHVPTGVKVISVLYYIGAVLGVLAGIFLILGAGMLGSLVEQIPLAGLFGGLFVVFGIVMIGFGVLGFFVGRGLWNGDAWARIVAIIFAGISVLFALISLIAGDFSSIFSLVVNGLIGYYLWFSNEVKAAFA